MSISYNRSSPARRTAFGRLDMMAILAPLISGGTPTNRSLSSLWHIASPSRPEHLPNLKEGGSSM